MEVTDTFRIPNISNGNGMYMFKFSSEDGMNNVVDNGPWIVKNKPLVVQKWNPHVDMVMSEPTITSLWVKHLNVPMEAWTTKSISTLASSLGKPLIMDAMTINLCNSGSGRVGYARVLVEMDVKCGFPEVLEICYRFSDKNTFDMKKIKKQQEFNLVRRNKGMGQKPDEKPNHVRTNVAFKHVNRGVGKKSNEDVVNQVKVMNDKSKNKNGDMLDSNANRFSILNKHKCSGSEHFKEMQEKDIVDEFIDNKI
ncbi:RNA-directed DNA polymerase, eukaryota, reverse transcriptase zinc-binding domain protein [Tanacetum coccineum]